MYRLQKLIDEMESNHFSRLPGEIMHHNSEDGVNIITTAIGGRAMAKNRTVPGATDGTDLLKVLFYQNLILARRIETLEAGGSRRV